MQCSALDSNKFKLKLPDLTAGMALFLFSDRGLFVGAASDTSEGSADSADSLMLADFDLERLLDLERIRDLNLDLGDLELDPPE